MSIVILNTYLHSQGVYAVKIVHAHVFNVNIFHETIMMTGLSPYVDTEMIEALCLQRIFSTLSKC